MNGKVYLLGSGPGDPELLTVKADRILRTVDVIFHDRLVSDQIVRNLPEAIDRVDCGKKAGRHKLSQDEINEKLYEEATQGRDVARLKGGDPLVFGRGGEEYRFLQDHGIPVEIVPGITAATAAASELGIPLTDRHVASEVTFLTGHEAPKKSADELDWDCMATCRKTLVIYMGVNQLPNITETLVEKGRDPETPALAVEKATSDQQRILNGTLETLPAKAETKNLEPPALIVIGEVGDFFTDLDTLKDDSPSRCEEADKTQRPTKFHQPLPVDNELLLWT